MRREESASSSSIVDLALGARVIPEGVAFKVWAPRATRVAVEIADAAAGEGQGTRCVDLSLHADGMFEGVAPGARAGDDYVYVLDPGPREKRRPDPVSRWQPAGVFGPSRVVDPTSFRWTDAGWRGATLEGQVLYELHIGTFTTEGTFDAAIGRLDHLVELGVTAIEIMPIAEFPGSRNWGYDGVHLFAPQSTYGGPDALRRLVDACHQRGLSVVLDVVYNHFGPEGCALLDYAPFTTDRYRTPWGDAINVDGPDSDGVRRHLVTNAVHWLRHFHIDGLRLDAADAIVDGSPRHLLEELAIAFEASAREVGRRAFLIAESDANHTRFLRPRERGGCGLDGQWNDDFHHAVRALLTSSRAGYFADFGAVAHVERALVDGFVLAGQRSIYRRRRHGAPFGDSPGSQLVVYIQNHDQVANASGGARLATLVGRGLQRVAAALLFVAPNVPMLFMGEEYAEVAPFHYFVDHADPGLVAAVVDGRKREHGELAEAMPLSEFVDPSIAATFSDSKLDWSRVAVNAHAEHLAFVRRLVSLRRSCVALSNGRRDMTRAWSNEEARWLVVERSDPSGVAAIAFFNFASAAQRIPWTSELPPDAFVQALASEASQDCEASVVPAEMVRCDAASCVVFVRRV